MEKLNFKNRLILYVTLINFVTLILSYTIFINTKIDNINKNIRTNLYEMGNFIATDKRVISSLEKRELNPNIDKLMDRYISIFKDIDIIVVTDVTGKKYSHLDKTQIGKNFVNPVNWNSLLEKKGYYSTMKGSMGVTTRWFEPIISNGKTIGFVMVGKYESNIKNMNLTASVVLIPLFFTALTMAFILAIFFARIVKKAILGLEPEEISQLHIKENLIINNLESGLIVLNNKNEVVKVNKVFLKMFSSSEVEKILEMTKLFFEKKAITRTELTIKNSIYHIKILPLLSGENIFGHIILLDSRDVIDTYARKITGMDQLVEGMRANIHEFKNRLHVILGLININKIDLAKKYILEAQELNEYDFKKYNNIKNPFLKAILLGKEAICKERKIEFILDNTSTFDLQSKDYFIEDLSTIIGNLIENSIEAFIDTDIENKFIQVKLSQSSSKLLISVTDNGKSIPDGIVNNIFDYGFSTKGENRGVGLYLVQEKLKLYNGSLKLQREPFTKTFIIEVNYEKYFNS